MKKKGKLQKDRRKVRGKNWRRIAAAAVILGMTAAILPASGAPAVFAAANSGAPAAKTAARTASQTTSAAAVSAKTSAAAATAKKAAAKTTTKTAAAKKTDAASASADPVTTKVSGLKTSIKRTTWTGTPADTITVKPAWGRKVKLYYYDSAAKKWILKQTLKTADQESAKVKLVYTKEWKNRYQTTWKIVIPKKAAFTRTVAAADSTAAGSSGAASGTSAASAASGTSSGTATAVASATAAAGASSGTTQVTVPESKKYSKKIKVTTNYVNGASAVVYDPSTNQIVYAKNPNTKRKPASMTKMMTAILLSENKGWNDKISITSEAANTPWGIGVKTGDQIKAKYILYAMMLPSANDAACAAGIAIGGTTANFASMMTARAKELGAANTVYQNAHGLDTTGNYSTAIDTARIGAYLMSSADTEMVRKAIQTKKYSFTSSKKGIKYTLYTSDAMLSDDDYDFVGIKTGTTTLGGYCFCGAFNYEGKQYISVVMGASNNTNRWSDTRQLADLTEYAVDQSLGEYSL